MLCSSLRLIPEVPFPRRTRSALTQGALRVKSCNFANHPGREGVSSDVARNVARAIFLLVLLVTTQAAPSAQHGNLDLFSQPYADEYGNGGPVLVLYGPYSYSGVYLGTILEEIGIPYKTVRIDTVKPSTLGDYPVVLLGRMPLTDAQANMLTRYALNQGHLIAMRPDQRLHDFFGIVESGSMDDAYYLVQENELGGGITLEPIQYHGKASLYTTLSSQVNTSGILYEDDFTASTYPLVTTRASKRGSATAFAFDVAMSIILTQQGNPEWIDQERDGIPPLRIGDLFYPDFVDLEKIHIPQADELKWLLGNVVLELSDTPIPRTWIMPHGHSAVIIYTGDDHGAGGTVGQFDRAIMESDPSCDFDAWTCYHGSSYIFTGAISRADAQRLDAEGFEIALHPNTGCWTYSENLFDWYLLDQLNDFMAVYGPIGLEPGLPIPTTSRIHCIAWGGWVNAPRVMVQYGMGLSADPYHWPPTWLQAYPGFMTGTGLLPLFAELSGLPVGYPYDTDGVRSMTTHMTDETLLTEVNVTWYFDVLLGGAAEYPAWIGTNFHTDTGSTHFALTPMYTKAAEYGAPIVSARTALDWIRARDNTVFRVLEWQDGSRTLTFTLEVDPMAHGLQLMLPLLDDSQLPEILVDTLPYGGDIEIFYFKGITYARIQAQSGSYRISNL